MNRLRHSFGVCPPELSVCITMIVMMRTAFVCYFVRKGAPQKTKRRRSALRQAVFKEQRSNAELYIQRLADRNFVRQGVRTQGVGML